MLLVNNQQVPFTPGLRLGDLADRFKPQADVLLLNGRQANPETLLQDGDHCILIKRGEIPSALDVDQALRQRHSPEVHERLRRAIVGIMGLGGLGSAVAVSLVKVGIGQLRIADFDIVELSNIHRQHYFIDQIGMTKAAALKSNLVRINPFVAVTPLEIELTAKNIPRLFAGVDVLVECFDDPAMKAAALRTALSRMESTPYVGSSGMAGYGSGNSIITRRVRPRVYIVGDDTTDVQTCGSLLAPRVGIAAHHQANQVVRLLLGIDRA